MKGTMTVEVAALRAELDRRMTEIREEHENSPTVEALKAHMDKVRKGATADGYRERLAEWFAQVSEGLEDGSIEVGDNGRLKGAPDKPKRDRLNDSEGRKWYSQWSVESCEKQLRRWEALLNESLQPLVAAMKMLDLASASEIEVEIADYQALLAVSAPSPERYY